MSSVQSIERAFDVLGALAGGPLGVTEVADRAGLPKSTAARLLATLAREGAVEQVPGDTRYRLGPRLATLAAGLTPVRSLAALAHLALAELAASAGEAAGPGGPGRRPRPLHRPGRHAQPGVGPRLDRIRGSRSTRSRRARSSSPSGRRPRSSATSSGRWSGSRRRTLVDRGALRERLRAIRRDGYAWVREEFDEGINSVAAPIADASGEVDRRGPPARAVVPLPGGRARTPRWPSESWPRPRASRGRCAGRSTRVRPAPAGARR